MSILHEPHLLSSYTPSLRSITEDSFIVDVTCAEYGHKGFATASVQGDGVHVLEVSEMRPVISHTLGPDTHFICPSITRVDDSGTLSTYAVTNTSNKGTEYLLRKWTDSLSESLTRFSEQKSSPNFIENIHRIYPLPKWQSKLIAVSVSGHIYVLSTETLTIDQFFQYTTSNSTLFRSFVFPPESCTFASHCSSSEGTLIVRFFVENKTLSMNICSLSSTGLKEVASCDLCGGEITDLTCSPSGYIMVLTSIGTWRVFRLDEQGKIMKEVASNPHSQSKTAKHGGFALTSVTPSFVLLACAEGSTNLHFALWDLRFSVVLATQAFSLPSNLTIGHKVGLQISLVAARQTEVAILVSPSQRSQTPLPPQSRSAIFILPITISKSSSIALAMGKASGVPIWLPNIQTSMPFSQGEGARQSLLHRIGTAINRGLPHEADTIFFTWVEDTAGIKAQSENVVDRLNKSCRQPANKLSQWPKLPKLSHHFVTTLLGIVLQPAKGSDIPYSSKIPLYLIERRAISDNMVQGGFVHALRRKGDWKSICVALQNMADIPEQEIVNLLTKVLDHHKRISGVTTMGDDSMDIESPDEVIPSLADFLPMAVRYPLSSVSACHALKTSFTHVDDVILILQGLDQLLETVHKQDFTNPVVDLPSLPPLPSILSFMQYMLDAHFLTLLQHHSTAALLRRISGRLEENLITIQEFDQLREPLGRIFQAQGSARAAGNREHRKDKTKNTFNAVIGLYQVEELVL